MKRQSQKQCNVAFFLFLIYNTSYIRGGYTMNVNINGKTKNEIIYNKLIDSMNI